MTEMAKPASLAQDFSLVNDPWILTRLAGGSSAVLSLREAFRRADEIRDIACELPTQDFAILRLMLAIIYRAVGGDFTRQQWSTWHSTGLPLEEIDAYLDRFEDRFRLFDPTRPFFQVADLATTKGDHKDVAPLIFDLPNKRLFTNRDGAGAESLSYAEAARWLINAQAFEVDGIKSGAVGDGRVKNGKGYSIGLGFTGSLGGFYAAGPTLRDTLLLNLVGTSNTFALDPEHDLPPWEDVEADTSAERSGLVSHGPVRLYTFQSRRIRLFRDGDRVVGCLVCIGDKLTPQNMQRREPMSAWRYSEPQTAKAKQPTYMPREHVAGRALWRGINAILPGIAPNIPKKDIAASLVPASISWLELLTAEGMLEESERIRFRAVGVVYGSHNSVVDEVISDELLLSVALLSETNRGLAIEAQTAVTLAEEGARAIRQLTENLVRAAGGDGEAAGIHARDRAYAALDTPYRTWLAGLDEDTDALDASDQWRRIARDVLFRLGEELISAAGPAAWVGREVNRLGTSTLITTSRAEGWFRSALTRTFGAPTAKDAAA